MVAECSYDLRKRVIKLIEEGETIAKVGCLINKR